MLTSRSLLLTALSLLLLTGTACRKRRTVAPPPGPAPEAAAPAPAADAQVAPAPAPAVAISPASPAPPSFETSSEFDDLNKDFELYCARKGRVPADVNEFFREQRIRPPAVPAGKRLGIDPASKRIVLLK